MLDQHYASCLRAQLVEPLRQNWALEALPLSAFEWLNAGLLVRHRQRQPRAKPLFVALPAHIDELGVGLRAATAAAWLAGHELPVGPASATPLQPGDHVLHDKAVWLVHIRPDAAGNVGLRRVSDNRARLVPAAHCRKLVAPFEFAGLLDDRRAGYRYEGYRSWLDKLLAGTEQAQRLFRIANKESLPRPQGGHTIILVPASLRYPEFEHHVGRHLVGAPIYWARRGMGKDHWNLPFAPSMHVVSSLTEALELRRRKAGVPVWHLSVVGKAAVGNSLRVAQLVQAYERQQWASLTFWGSDLGVGETPGCVVWPWSRLEARGPQAPPDPVRLTVVSVPPLPPPAASLAARVAAVREVLAKLSQPVGPATLPVRLPMMWHLLHRCLRYALPPGVASRTSRAYLAELSQQLTASLESDELGDAFDDANRWRDLKPASAALKTAFAHLLTYFQDYSPKYDTLQSLAAEARDDGRPVIVVADRESLTAAQTIWRTQLGVEVLPLLGGPDNLRQRLRKGQLPADAWLLVPFLFNRDQLAELQTAPSPVRLVLLAEVEDGLYARTQESLRQQAQAQLRAGGRAALLGQTYEQLVSEATVALAAPRVVAPGPATGSEVTSGPAILAPAATTQLDYFEELYAVGEARYASERQRGRASGQLYALAFADGYCTELDGHTRVLRRESPDAGADAPAAPELAPRQVDELQAGDQVIFYENDQPRLIDHILRQHDRYGLVQRIDVASAVWQQALRQLANCYASMTSLYDALQRHGGLDVGLQTLRNYLDGRRRFPGDPTTLPALHQLAERHELLQCRLLAPGAADEVRHCRTKFQQLSIALGKGLSEEVLRFRLTGAKGSLLSKLDPDTLELVLLSAVERTLTHLARK